VNFQVPAGYAISFSSVRVPTDAAPAAVPSVPAPALPAPVAVPAVPAPAPVAALPAPVAMPAVPVSPAPAPDLFQDPGIRAQFLAWLNS